jgi:hypothetical protein
MILNSGFDAVMARFMRAILVFLGADRMAEAERTSVAILRDARPRSAPQDEADGGE